MNGHQFEIVNGMYGVPISIEEDEYTITVYFINHGRFQRTFTKSGLSDEELRQIRSSLDRYKTFNK